MSFLDIAPIVIAFVFVALIYYRALQRLKRMLDDVYAAIEEHHLRMDSNPEDSV